MGSDQRYRSTERPIKWKHRRMTDESCEKTRKYELDKQIEQ